MIVHGSSPVAWPHRIGSRWRDSPAADPETLRQLHRAVEAQWQAEVSARELNQPHPLRLRWRPASPKLRSGAVSRVPLRGELLLESDDGRPPAAVLANEFDAHPARQLVILGEPGGGKTTLAVLFTLAVLAPLPPDDPVPVIFAIAGWDPAQPVNDWLARRLITDYPQVFRQERTARRLLAEHRVMPVLDGLDEMPQPRRQEALKRIEESAGRGMRMVITCRSAEFEETVGVAGVLSRAAVVEIEPVRSADAARFLTQREAVGSRRWQPVVATMRAAPDGPLAAVLSTPLMIGLCRQVFRGAASDPERLLTFRSPSEIEHHLLEKFLPSVYPDEEERARAGRWLAFLANHLRDRMRDPNLEWGRLARAVPRPVVAALVALIPTLAAAAVAIPLFAIMESDEPGQVRDTLKAILITAVLAAAIGLHVAWVSHAPPGDFAREKIVAVRRGAGAGLLLVIGALAVPSLLAGLTVLTALLMSRPAGTALNNFLFGVLSGNDVNLALIDLGLILVVVVANAVAAGRGSAARRFAPRFRDLPKSLAYGLRAGLLASLLLALVLLGLLVVTLGPGPAAWAPGALIAVVALVLGLLIAVPVAMVRWLNSAADTERAISPDVLLRDDRRATFLTGAVVVVVGVAALPIAVFVSVYRGMLLALGPLSVGIVMVLGSGSWLPYTVARCWLAASGRLPWRPARFQREAHRLGILRQAGSAYQFRHDLLRNYLADRWPTSRPRAVSAVLEAPEQRQARSVRRRVVRAVTALVAIAALPAISVSVERSVRPDHEFDAGFQVEFVVPDRERNTLIAVDSPQQRAIALSLSTGALWAEDFSWSRMKAPAHLLSGGPVLSPEQHVVVVTGYQNTELLSEVTRRRLAVLPYRYRESEAVFIDGGRRLVTATSDGHVAVWNVVELTTTGS